MDDVTAQNTFKRQSRLLHCARGALVFGVTRSLEAVNRSDAETGSRNRRYCFRHKAFTPMCAGEDKTEFNAMAVRPQVDHSDRIVLFFERDRVRKAGTGRPAVLAVGKKVLRDLDMSVRFPDEIASHLGILRIRTKDRVSVGGDRLAKPKPFSFDLCGQHSDDNP